jgi:type III secretory pathway component EscS
MPLSVGILLSVAQAHSAMTSEAVEFSIRLLFICVIQDVYSLPEQTNILFAGTDH